MSADALNRVLTAIPALTPAERAEVKKAVTMSNALGGTPDVIKEDIHPYESLYLQAICDVLQSMGVEYTSVPMLRRGDTVEGFRERAENVHAYLKPSSLSRAETMKIVRFGVSKLYENLMQLNLPITGRVIMRHFDRVPAMIEQSFPRYARGGFLAVVAKRKRQYNVRTEPDRETGDRPRHSVARR